MNVQSKGVLLDEPQPTLDELAFSCTVSHEWIIEHVRAGVFEVNPEAEPSSWMFTGNDLMRSRRIASLERDFDANPELAGLVCDLLEELDRLRARLRRMGDANA